MDKIFDLLQFLWRDFEFETKFGFRRVDRQSHMGLICFALTEITLLCVPWSSISALQAW